MLFNSYIFLLLFLPATLIGYFALNKVKKYQLAKAYLIGMSFWFYGFNNFYYLFIIIGSILFNYTLSMLMHRTDKKVKLKILLSIGVIFNIGILIYYKYFDFFIENFNFVFGTDFNFLYIILPLGISFFTFQQVSFIVDCYKKKVPKYNILDYSLFVTFFPQLVAGPIVLHDEIIPQFENKANKSINFENLYKGIYAFSFGLGKKVLLADTLSIVVGYGFSDIENLGALNTIIVMLAYTMQIALDFSGYSDMAIGIGSMFNIDITLNFNNPYKSLNIAEFWDRWHMTLTRFLKTYVYFPLGGNRKGVVRTYINKVIVFVVSGLWHGANWTFVIWGLMHGIGITIVGMFGKTFSKIPKFINWIITFIFVNLTWVVFRATSINEAFSMYGQLGVPSKDGVSEDILLGVQLTEIQYLISSFEKHLPQNIDLIYLVVFLSICLAVSIFCMNVKNNIKKLKPNIFSSLKIVAILFLCTISFSGVSEFIYFNF